MAPMIYRFGSFTLDTELLELRGAQGPVTVEPQVFSLLAYLIENRSRVVSKDELIDAVWDGQSEGGLRAGGERREPRSAGRKGIGCDGGALRQPRAATADNHGLHYGRLDAFGRSRPRGHARSDNCLPQNGRRRRGALTDLSPSTWAMACTFILATPLLMNMTPSRPCVPALPSSTRSARRRPRPT